jgi:hypothetical protein
VPNQICDPPAGTGRSRPARRRHAVSRRSTLTAGGTDGNERLTALTGLLLIVLLAVLGVTIVRIGQLLWLHLFLGLLLLGPVALKLLSVGYRFVRYYTNDAAYRGKGPPPPALRALAPLVVLTTLAVFATGVLLLILGPSSRQPWVLVHKVTFIAWGVFTGLHVLGHLPEIARLVRTAGASRRAIVERQRSLSRGPAPLLTGSPARPTGGDLPGRAGRLASLSVAVVLGVVLALALVPQFAAWTH